MTMSMGFPEMPSAIKELAQDPFQGINCIHPDFKETEIRDIQGLRECIFSRKDPNCLEHGFKCNCLRLFMQPVDKRKSLSAHNLCNPANFLCRDCHVKNECFVNVAMSNDGKNHLVEDSLDSQVATGEIAGEK